MKVFGKVALVVAIGLSVGVASAAENAAMDPVWKGEAELGVVATRGNTRTQTVSGKASATTDRTQWRHLIKLEALTTAARDKATGEDNTTAERYGLSGKSDYKFTEHDYAFGALNYESDRFTGFDYRSSEVLGYGRRILNNADLTLDAEAGPGARQSKPKSGSTDNEMVFRVSGNLAWKLSKTATFTEEVSADIGEVVTISKSTTSLKAQVAGSLAMKVSLVVKHVSSVPAGVNKTDAETALTLVYSY